MSLKVLKKERLEEFLHRARALYSVFAPKTQGDHTVLAPFGEGDTVTLTHRGTKDTLKTIFFPRSEELFRFEGTTIAEAKEDSSSLLVFGHHPCDARSLLLLDKIFDDPVCKDNYYLNRRERGVLFTVACYRSEPSCFCTSVGGLPSDTQGSDLLGTFLGDRFVVKTLSQKGEHLIRQFPEFFDNADDNDSQTARKQAETVSGSIIWKEDLSGIKKKLDGMFEHALWERIHLRCLGCGVCTFHCPTCYCFDIGDETSRTEGKRVRGWDSCMYSQYTRHASGLNPRPSGKERWRQRFMHKFQQTVERYGDIFCVGCGRCVRNCPVRLDIREVIGEVKKATV